MVYLSTTHYQMKKTVKVKNRNLALFRTFMIVSAVLFVIVVEIWGLGGWASVSTVVGAIGFKVLPPEEPQLLTDLSYCEQSTRRNATATTNITATNTTTPPSSSSSSSSYFPFNRRHCEFHDVSSASVTTDQSVSIATTATIQDERLVCEEHTAVDCQLNEIYEPIGPRRDIFVAQTEGWQIVLDHVVANSEICNQQNNQGYACSSESATYGPGRMYSVSDDLCKSNPGATYDRPTKGRSKTSAPCWIQLNSTQGRGRGGRGRGGGDDVVSLEVLLQATGVSSLDQCKPQPNFNHEELIANGICQTYRETGALILLNIYWNDFVTMGGSTGPYYYYRPTLLEGSPFELSEPHYHYLDDPSHRNRTIIHQTGVRITTVVTGSFHSFSFLWLLLTIFSVFGIIKVLEILLKYWVSWCSPKRKQYKKLKCEKHSHAEEEVLDRGSTILNDDDQQPPPPPPPQDLLKKETDVGDNDNKKSAPVNETSTCTTLHSIEEEQREQKKKDTTCSTSSIRQRKSARAGTANVEAAAVSTSAMRTNDDYVRQSHGGKDAEQPLPDNKPALDDYAGNDEEV